jgi:hypothetical protein
MPLTSALLLVLAATAGEARLLLCRPMVQGDLALARADAVPMAARGLEDLLLDYGVPCESAGEAVRASVRAGLGHAVLTTAEGRGDGTAYRLVLVASEGGEGPRRALLVPPGADAVRPLRAALEELAGAVPRPPARWSRVAAWSGLGLGLAALAAGVVMANQAHTAADQATRATTAQDYREAQGRWRARRAWGVGLLAAGGTTLAAGLVLRLAF